MKRDWQGALTAGFVLAAIFVAWEAGVHLFGVKPILLPPPSSIWKEF